MRITKCRGGSGVWKGGDPCVASPGAFGVLRNAGARPLNSFVDKDKGL